VGPTYQHEKKKKKKEEQREGVRAEACWVGSLAGPFCLGLAQLVA
jgi:hypothetical protein